MVGGVVVVPVQGRPVSGLMGRPVLGSVATAGTSGCAVELDAAERIRHRTNATTATPPTITQMGMPGFFSPAVADSSPTAMRSLLSWLRSQNGWRSTGCAMCPAHQYGCGVAPPVYVGGRSERTNPPGKAGGLGPKLIRFHTRAHHGGWGPGSPTPML